MILVVDDERIVVELLVDCLKAVGQDVVAAAGGPEAMAIIEARRPELIILDIQMPQIDGMTLLATLRARAATASIPVVLLTGKTDRQLILQASRLGVREYMLKANFSVRELLERVDRALVRAAAPTPPAPATPAKPAPIQAPEAQGSPRPAPRLAPSSTLVSLANLTPLTTRQKIIERAQNALDGRTLSGMVAEVISMAASPRTSTTDLASVIVRDPMLAANVLRAANSAAYTTARSTITNIPDAIKKIGCAAVGRIAAAIAVIDAMPDNRASSFNPVRAWQHSFAVAQLCQSLAPQDNETGGLPYLVGLCHDLTEILFHAHFSDEATQVLEAQQETGRPRAEVERQLLGMTQAELVPFVLERLSLPESIRKSIVAYHHGLAIGTPPSDPMARVLWLAELYANGILLTSCSTSLVSPIPQALCAKSVGEPNPPCPDATALRAEVFCLTTLMAQISSRDGADLAAPIFRRRNVRIWLARDSAFSSFDPLEAALGGLAHVQVSNRLPMAAEAEGVDGVIVAAAPGNIPCLEANAAWPAGPLVLNTASAGASAGASATQGAVALPITLADLSRFINQIQVHTPALAAA